jgi:hypothetical protein
MADRALGLLGPRKRLLASRGCCVGIRGWNSTTRYEITNGGAGGSSEMSRVMVFRVDTLPAVFQIIVGRGTIGGAGSGWEGRVSSGARIQWIVVTAAATATAPEAQLVAGHVGQVIIAFCTLSVIGGRFKAFWTPGGTVTEVGAPGTAVAAYTPSVATEDYTMGARSSGGVATLPCVDLTLISMAGADATVWTTPQMQAIADDVRANCGRIQTATPGETFRFNADDVFPPANWAGDAGGTATILGATQSLVVRTKFNPVYQ